MFLGFRFRIRNQANQRSWTETWYRDFESSGITSPFNATLVRNYATFRCRALSAANYLVDVTLFDPATPRDTIIIELNIPGSIQGEAISGRSNSQDVAPVALLVAFSSASRVRQYLMRGIPDSAFVVGEYSPAPLQDVGVRSWLTTVVQNQFEILTFIRSPFTPPGIISTVGAAGIVLAAPLTVPSNADTLLAVKTTVAGGGRVVSTRVLSGPGTPIGGTLIPCDWKHGNCVGGLVDGLSRTHTPIVRYAIRTAVRTRKTGGPLGKFRGRR